MTKAKLAAIAVMVLGVVAAAAQSSGVIDVCGKSPPVVVAPAAAP